MISPLLYVHVRKFMNVCGTMVYHSTMISSYFLERRKQTVPIHVYVHVHVYYYMVLVHNSSSLTQIFII